VPVVAAAPATKPLKPPAAKIGKIATKFPRMFKVLGFLKGIPGLGKTLAIAPILAAAAMGASVSELIPLIGAVLGGVLGWSGGAFLGGMIGAAGGPLALVTGALGGIAGGLLGDYLGTSLSQWIMGQKADGMPWGFGWIDNLLNSGKGSDDPVSKPIASKKPNIPKAAAGGQPNIPKAAAGGQPNIPKAAAIKLPPSVKQTPKTMIGAKPVRPSMAVRDYEGGYKDWKKAQDNYKMELKEWKTQKTKAAAGGQPNLPAPASIGKDVNVSPVTNDKAAVTNDKVAEEKAARYAELGKITAQDRKDAEFSVLTSREIAAERVRRAKIMDEMFAEEKAYRKKLADEHKLASKNRVLHQYQIFQHRHL
jgi:hypothetical protein